MITHVVAFSLLLRPQPQGVSAFAGDVGGIVESRVFMESG